MRLPPRLARATRTGRPPRVGDHAVGGQPVTALERPDRALGARSEHAVGPDAEAALGEAHAWAAVGDALGGPPGGVGAAAAQRAPGRGARDAVGRQPVPALE